jgi:hypothetical protein
MIVPWMIHIALQPNYLGSNPGTNKNGGGGGGELARISHLWAIFLQVVKFPDIAILRQAFILYRVAK